MNKTERDELIIDLRKQDKTFRQIAEEIGCGLGTVRKVVRAYPGNDIRKEQLRSAMSFEQAQAKYCPDDFDMLEYHPGQTDAYIKLKCKTCGHEFTKQMVSFRGRWSQNKTHCPECDRLEREVKQKQAEQLKRKRERERALAITGEQLSFNICPVCKELFKGKRKYCSRECYKKECRRRHRHIRRVHIRTQLIDRDITLERLAERDSNKCWLCNGTVDWNDYVMVNNSFVAGERYPSIDHIVPLSKDGTHAWQNIKLAHFGCNRDKGAEIV